MKLHRQLVLLVLAALLPLVVLSAVLGAGALRAGQDAMQRDAESRLGILAAGVSHDLAAQVDVLDTLAVSPLLDAPLSRAAFDAFSTRLLRRHPLWLAVTLTSPTGERLMDTPAFPGPAGSKVVDRVSHALAVSSGRPVIGRILKGPRGNPAFDIFAPVVRDGRVIAVLGAVVRPDSVRGLLVANGLPKEWRAGVLDGSGRIVTRTALPDYATRAAPRAVLDALAASPAGLYRSTGLDGAPFVTVYRVLPGVGWSVHVSMPRDRYEAPFLRAVWLISVGAFVSLLIMGLFLSQLWRELRLRQREAAKLEESRRLESLGRMTGGVAHDFNNLLMIVMGSADMLKRRLGDPEGSGDRRALALVGAILSAAQRGQSLTRQLLAFARRSSHEPVSFRLQDRADELLVLLRRTSSGEIAVVMEAPPDLWPIHADPEALEVALINLAVNARDAMPGGGRLTVAAENVTLQKGRDGDMGLVGDFVSLSVTDTGVGIAPENLEHVFEPFYTTKPAGKGTGLGLSQVYGFARQSGGAVAVTSRIGEGTSVTLHLPRATRAPAVAAPVRRPVDDADDGRILLVEDNPDVAEITQTMLSSIGYAVTWAPDAATAQGLMAGPEQFDALVSDIVMGPGMSGLELAAWTRRERPELPILLVTGYSEALANGASHGFQVLAKPYGQSDLAAAIRRARTRGVPAETPAL